MAHSLLATVDRNGKLSLSSQTHGAIGWLFEELPVPCVVQVAERGVVLVEPLRRWAEGEGLSIEKGRERLENAWSDPGDSQYIHTFFRQVTAASSGPGRPVRLISLPHMALYAVFEQGTGPLEPRKGKGFNSGTVLIVIRKEYFEIWSRDVL